MSKQLDIKYRDKEYKLEFTRKSVEIMERQGFVASDVDDKPMTVLPALFAGAFIANHRYINSKLIEEIYEHMRNKKELIGKLTEMYNEPINALLDEPEDEEGNAEWTASW